MDPPPPDPSTRVLTNAANRALVLCVLLYALTAAGGRISFDPGAVSDQVRDGLLVALVCGAGSFGTIEILKRMLRLRGVYQRRQVRSWLEHRFVESKYYQCPPSPFDELLGLMSVTTGNRSATRDELLRAFNLPTEQLAAQISAAADMALALQSSPRLLAALSGEKPDNVAAWLERAGPGHESGYDIGLPQRVRAGIDQLQISVGERWREYVQGAALWISGFWGIALAHALPVTLITRPGGQPPIAVNHEARFVLAALVIGGPIAWILRDLAAVVERARR